MGDAAQGEPLEPEPAIDETLAQLFAAVYVADDSILLTELAKLARRAGFDESEIASSQTHAKDELVQGGSIHVE